MVSPGVKFTRHAVVVTMLNTQQSDIFCRGKHVFSLTLKHTTVVCYSLYLCETILFSINKMYAHCRCTSFLNILIRLYM